MTAEELALKIERVDARSRSNTHRIEEIERNQSALTDLALSVKERTVVKSDIKTLTGKPAKRWEELVDKVVWLFVGAVLAYALGQLGL